MPHNDRSRPGDDSGTAHETVNGTKTSVPPPVPPGATPLYVAGLWVIREPHWRDTVDLGTAPRHQVYAAGLFDGAELAYVQLKDTAALLIDHYGLLRDCERAERRYRRSA